MVDDVIINDNETFQWKNSSHTLRDLSLSGKYNDTDDNTNRDTDTHRELLSPEMKAKLEDLVCDYYDHFDTMITVDNRETVRDAATCFWDYAKNKLYGKAISGLEDSIDEERRILDQKLCAQTVQLANIAGTTRCCFVQSLKAKAMAENASQMAKLRFDGKQEALALEIQAINLAFNSKFRAFIEADQIDFNKYMTAFELLKGACIDETIDDIIDRDIRERGVDVVYRRRQGDVSDTDGTYTGTGDTIATAAQAAINAITSTLNLTI